MQYSRMDMDEGSHILSRDNSMTAPSSPTSSHASDMYQLVDNDEEKRQKSNIPMASFNFINSIIGSGIIGMPFALKQAGFGMGIILLILVSIMTDYSLILLIHGGELSNTYSYQDLVRAAFGRPGFYVLTIMQFLYPLIAMISYNIIIGDTITKIVVRLGGESLRYSILGNRQFIIVIVTLLFTLPLSLYQNIAKLSKYALVAIVFLVFILIFMFIRGATMHIPATEGAWEFANYNITSALGIMAFAYMCHHNSFIIYDSLEKRSEKNWQVVTHLSVIFSMLCTLALAVTGYITFTGLTEGDVLENYCHKDDLANAARVIFAITIMLTFPIECFVTREVIEIAVFPNRSFPKPLWRHITITLVVVVTTVLISMLTDCLGIVLELNGVLNAAPLAYIIPPLCVMKLQQEPILCRKNIGPLTCALFGALVCVIGMVMWIYNLAQGVTCNHGREMAYCLKADGNASLVENSTHSFFTDMTTTSNVVTVG
ncbi:unnamed protein product [Owenia fusiformis]|uniref:Putative sodium-coupled neutral amino acid transporter 11 n=1 Tax=Owenia fusiformis TaxID=6347 RepID=A0A8J1UKI8_OWEFU|nr:unnamed protein product [Owenia fusiformis]